MKLIVGSCGFGSHCSHLNFSSDITSVSSKEFLDIQAAIERVFTLKGVCHMIKNIHSNAPYK